MKNSSFRHGRVALVALMLAFATIALRPIGTAADTGLSPLVGVDHVLWPAGLTQQANANNLIYHGGLVETPPSVYLIFWGPEWSSGFSRTAGGQTYTQKTVENYIKTYFGNVGGSPYAGIQTQYCQNISAPSFDCAGNLYAQYITNPKAQLKGAWVDSSAVPSTIVTTGLVENTTSDPLETEAVKAATHFGYDVNATYFILTQPGTQATAYGSVYCAYHSETSHTTGHGVRYAFMPYVMDYAAGCGENSVNATDDSFGHGYLDGYSIVAGHEWAEAITDPDNQNGTQDGWNDIQTAENGDKCAWTNLQNISLGGHSFAAQPLWSNAANGGGGGCVFSL